MKLPRNLSGAELIKGLTRFGYSVERQAGSHVSLTTQINGEHHVTVPLHSPLKVGTLSGILGGVARHYGIDRDELLRQMKIV
jgi:predicted RNA binding protein YcfA (HicA-like mRNA interferase family)